MKRNLMAIILALCLLGASFAGAEGLLPSLVDTIGKPMPSLGEALGRYPEEEMPEADGGNTEVFREVTETDFNTFSVYLSEKGAVLADYQAVGSSFSASINVEGKTIHFGYDMQTLEARVTYPKGTYDEWLEYAKTQFESAAQLLDEGKTDDGLAVLVSIPNYSGYGPAAKYLEARSEIAAAATREAKLVPFRNVGGYVTFGSYELDYNTENGREPIEWLVLDYDAANQRVLLLSRYGLDVEGYNEDFRYLTWEKCTLRTWLNSKFINNAFSTAEQGAILTTTVDNSRSQCYSGWDTDGGNDTQDKVFLLSYAEANKYLGVTVENHNNMKSRMSPTSSLQKRGENISLKYASDSDKTSEHSAAGMWWLRSPGRSQYYAAIVESDGSLDDCHPSSLVVCDRPALWINLESDIF